LSGPTRRVAVTLEQCWHRVPGGVARAAVGSARAVAVGHPGIEQVGVAARHRRPAPPPWQPPIPVRHLPLPRRALYEGWHTLRWPPVQRATGPVDVVHATGMAIPPDDVPLVVTVHDLAWKRWPEFFSRRGVRFFRRSLELTRERAALVVCPSESAAVDAVESGLDPGRVRVVPWGVDQRAATPAAVAATRGRYDLERPYVLWVGTIEPRKNLPVVVEAFAKVARRDLDLVLVGPEGWREAVPAVPSAVEGRVRPLGFVDEDHLGPLFAGAELFCYPSLLEGFGFPVAEAMVQGTPVVTSHRSATEEVLGRGGLAVDPGSSDAVAGALEAVLDDRQRFSELARARGTTFTWERTAERLADAYLEVAR
jgi:glycosyltransferase involved in cell wall biosynthesis